MILPIMFISLKLAVNNASDHSQEFIMLAVETLWDSGEHSHVQKEISALGGGSTRGREVLGPTLVGGFPGGQQLTL